MKRTLIALGVAATVALPVAAQAAPTVYGKMNIAIEKFEKDVGGTADTDNWRLQSYASRIGVKGEDALTDSLSAVYGIEWEVSADGNSGTDMGQRNRFVGIKSKDLGTLRLGRLDSNLKNAQGKVDLFNDTTMDMGSVVAGETRSNNVISYESPKFADAITFNVQLIPGEQAGVSGTPSDQYNGLADGVSASVAYDKDGLYVALAHDSEVAGNLNMVSSDVSRRDTTRVAASYTLADLTLGALYQMSDAVNEVPVAPGTAEQETAWLVSAAYKIDAVTLKGQYVSGKNDASVEEERTQWTVGADYGFNSKTKVFTYYGNYQDDTGAPVLASEVKVFALGMEHNF